MFISHRPERYLKARMENKSRNHDEVKLLWRINGRVERKKDEERRRRTRINRNPKARVAGREITKLHETVWFIYLLISFFSYEYLWGNKRRVDKSNAPGVPRGRSAESEESDEG